MSIDLTGRVVIVTGSGRGVGRGHALRLAERGASVVVNDLGCDLDGEGRDPGPADAVVAEITARGGVAVADSSDVTQPDATQGLVELALDRFGRLDAVVGNAGLTGRQQPFEQTSWEALEKQIAIHVRSNWGLAQAAWPHFIQQNGGHVVFTTSGAFAGISNNSAYSAAKAALIGLTHTLALEGSEYNIVVNAIAPIALSRMSRAEVDDVTASLMARTVPAEAVAPAVVAMVSPEWTRSGEIYAVGGGHVDRFFTAQVRGLADEPDWKAETLLEQFDAIHQESGYFIPKNAVDTFAHIMFGAEPAAPVVGGKDPEFYGRTAARQV